jgi:hypothetical protein
VVAVIVLQILFARAKEIGQLIQPLGHAQPAKAAFTDLSATSRAPIATAAIAVKAQPATALANATTVRGGSTAMKSAQARTMPRVTRMVIAMLLMEPARATPTPPAGTGEACFATNASNRIYRQHAPSRAQSLVV